MKRLLTGAVAAALLGVTPVAVSAPARATDNLTSTTTVQRVYPSGNPVSFGQTVGIRAAVKGSDGDSVYDGTVTLYVRTPTAPSWKAVETKDASGYVGFTDFKARRKAEYYVKYSGYRATSTYEDNYTSSQSGLLKLPVARVLNLKGTDARKGVKVTGKVKPTYKRKKVVIHKKVKRRWRKYRTVRTNRRSTFKTVLPASRKGIKWRFTVPGNKQFVPTKMFGTTTVYGRQARSFGSSGGLG